MLGFRGFAWIGALPLSFLIWFLCCASSVYNFILFRLAELYGKTCKAKCETFIVVDSNGAARRAAHVAPFNYMPVDIIVYTDH